MTDAISQTWTSETNTITTYPLQELDENRSVNTILFANRPNHNLNLHGHKLTFGEGGIILEGSDVSIGNGLITSSCNFLNIISSSRNPLKIDTSIVDNGWRKVGLSIGSISGGSASVYLVGRQSNTFTGETNVVGRSVLNLDKTEGATAIPGNITAKEGGAIVIQRSDQISDDSRVRLISGGDSLSSLVFSSQQWETIKENVRELTVEGSGVIDFGLRDSSTIHRRRLLYLDDLIIGSDSNLKILAWADGRDRLLVSKESAHLLDYLKRIEFEGYAPNQVSLKEFNGEYWEISGLAEPAITGLGVAAAGLGLVAWSRRKRTRENLRG